MLTPIEAGILGILFFYVCFCSLMLSRNGAGPTPNSLSVFIRVTVLNACMMGREIESVPFKLALSASPGRTLFGTSFPSVQTLHFTV